MSKCRALLVTVLLVTSVTTFAQVQGIFAIKAGASSSRTVEEGVTPYSAKFKTDFHFGALYRLRYKRFVAHPEVLFALKGGSFKGARDGVIRNNYNYLSVPIMLGYIPTEGIALQVGPEFSYALNTPATNGPAVRSDFGVAVGAHYDFLDMADQFSLHVRYIHGLKNISTNPIVERYNRAFQVSIVYNFYKKR